DPNSVLTTLYPIAKTSNSIKTEVNTRCYFYSILVTIFTFCSLAMYAATYYIAPNGSDAAIGDITHPFATLNKAWTKVVAGDLVYMRGGTYNFTSQQALSGKNGTAGNLIKVWAYTGETPIITFTQGTATGITLTGNYIEFKGIEINGLTTLTGWTDTGNGIYSKTLTGTISLYSGTGTVRAIDMVTIDDINTPFGRYPNATNTNGGYLTIDSHSGATSITDAALPASPNFTGGELVSKTSHWVINRSVISDHTGQTITYAPFPGALAWDIGTPPDGNGYFIQNHINTLDQFGEWCYNGTTLSMYFGANTPTSHVVKASTISDLFIVSNCNNVTLDDMTFQGGNYSSLKNESSNNTIVQNCDINYSGKYGIQLFYYSDGLQILNSSVKNSNSGAILLDEENNNTIISGNTIENTGIYPGMYGKIRLKCIGEAISSYNSDNTIVSYNRIINTGYNGTKIEGSSSMHVRNNFIDTFCFVKDDGAGIYMYGGDATISKEVKNNIVLNGIGAIQGTESWANTTGYIGSANGIYMDDNTENVEIAGNTVANCCYDGISIHNASRINTLDNLLYNNRNANIDIVHDSYGSVIRNTLIDNNVTVSLGHESMGGQNVTQKALVYGTISNDVSLFGTSNNNYFISPLDNDPKFFTWSTNNSGYGTLRNFVGWKSYSLQDANSHLSPITVPDISYIRFEYNDTTVSKIVSLGETYIDAKGNQYAGTITLLPYTSAFLMRSSTTNHAPIIQNQSFSINENSANGTAIGSVAATDPDAGQTITYSILSGNTNGAFAINAASGALSVANSAALNYEIVTSFALVVKVLDNGSGNLSSQATVTINLLNVNEPPAISNQAFSVNENSANGTAVGIVAATDPDAGQTITYSILSGNTNGAFAINAASGAL
ncbi:MAG: cadherin domain-containing protein, partial [Bacteroidota bacterium]